MLSLKILSCIAALFCSALSGPPGSFPCKVPVFRYALEHWQPDAYELMILHRGTLSEDAGKLVAKLENSKRNDFINLQVATADVDHDEWSELLIQVLGPGYQQTINAPEILLLYPADSQSGPLAWRGPLTQENVDALIDSPARNQITEWIFDGESVVWVLIGCGDRQKDAAAEQLLRAEIARLEKEITMRDIEVIETEKQYNPDTKVELRVGIKLLVLDRDDPLEKIFSSTLIRSESDLDELGEPIAMPIFGRGRAYLSLAGKGINPKMIETTCRLLIGDCSCEIKWMNPGVDLLFAANWDSMIGMVATPEPPSDLADAGVYVEIPPGNNGPEQDLSDSEDLLTANESVEGTSLFGQSRVVWIAGFVCLAIVVIAVFARLGKQAR